MQEVRLTIKKRSFPSQGRVRLNVAHLPDLGILEGERVDLVNEATRKTVTTSVIADSMVREGQIRVSEEDLRTLGLRDEEEVLVRKTPPLEEKIKKAAAGANTSFSKGIGNLDKKVKKTSGDVKAGAAKATDTVREETKKASGNIGKAAVKTAGTLKKTVKKVTGSGEDL